MLQRFCYGSMIFLSFRRIVISLSPLSRYHCQQFSFLLFDTYFIKRTYTHTYTHMHPYIHTRTHAYTNADAHTQTHVHNHVQTCTHLYTHTHTITHALALCTLTHTKHTCTHTHTYPIYSRFLWVQFISLYAQLLHIILHKLGHCTVAR